MRYSHIFLTTLAFIAISDSSTLASPAEQDVAGSVEADKTKAALPAGKKPSAKISSSRSKRKASDGNATNGEAIVFPKVSKIEKPSDDWPIKSPEHSGRTRGGSGFH